MPRLGSSTAFRFAAWFSAAFTLVILILGSGVYWAIRSELRYELDQRVVTIRQAVLREAQGDAGLGTVIAERAAHAPGDMRYALLDAKGARIAGQEILSPPPKPGWSVMQFRKTNGAPDKTWVFATAVQGGGMLIIGADPEALEQLDEHMVPLFIAAFGLIAAIGGAGAFLLGRMLQRRLDMVNRTAEAIIAGDLASRIGLTGKGDEFDRLSATLNQMLDRIAALLGNLRQVSGDIAHDLRTPLTRLRQRLDLALAGPEDPTALKGAMHDAIEQTDDMLALFAAILSISEVEAGSGGIRMNAVDLSGLISDVAESYQPSAEDGGRSFDCAIEGGIVIQGNRELIAQLAVNLLDNALRHTPQGAAISLSLQRLDTGIVLTVADRGSGIPPADRDRVFDRFIRLEHSRSTPGHGLGLSLVAAIARAHGGTITIEDNHPGVKAMLTLPGTGR